jgi:hypothetical protein
MSLLLIVVGSALILIAVVDLCLKVLSSRKDEHTSVPRRR